MVPSLVVRAIELGSPPTKVSPSLSLARVLSDKSSVEASWESFDEGLSSSYGWPTAGEDRKEYEQAYLHSLALVGEGRRAIFPVPL
jgi:hypothetical protein